MIEDTRDKVRRNLVVMSSAIIVIAYLKLNTVAAIPFLPEELKKNVSAFDFWVIVSIALMYLFMRYHLDENSIEGRKDLVAHFRDMTVIKMDRIILKDIKRYFRTERKPRYCAENEPALAEYKKFLSTLFTPRNSLIETFTISWNGGTPTNWQGLISVKAVCHTKGKYPRKFDTSISNVMSYQLTGDARFTTSLYALFRTISYSGSAYETLVPYFLTVCAACVCGHKLIQTTPYCFKWAC